jgi:hypothetical protein
VVVNVSKNSDWNHYGIVIPYVPYYLKKDDKKIVVVEDRTKLFSMIEPPKTLEKISTTDKKTSSKKKVSRHKTRSQV